VNPEVLIIGCGFLGEAAAELFAAQGKRVLGLVRSESSLAALQGRNFEVATCDVTDASSVEALAARAQAGGAQGIMPVGSTAPQNQTGKRHDPSHHDHQQ
jgi:NAD(P)-dependent dehydrogenase (short-subunit alcohol dehydrogenase family)